VSGDLSLLLLTAVATAYGFRASLAGAPRRSVASWAAAALFLLIGVHAALVVTVSGPGEILPGHQLNPDLQQYWAAKLLAGELVAPRPEYLFGAILAYVLALVARPAKATAWRVAPALLAFLFLYVAIDRREPVSFAVRSSGDATAYVTMIPKGRVLFAIGHGQDVFVPVLHEKECGSMPPAPGLDWSRDGELVTFTTRGGKPFFAFDRSGATTGWLPDPGDAWPAFGKSVSDSVAYQRVVSTARVEVAKVLDEHGGPAGE
jgi:hypothetical protein